MDQQYSIDDQEQERHFIGNLLSDDEASVARSEPSSRQSHKLSTLPSFENVTSNTANAIGPSPNQAFWPEPPPPYSPPLCQTFAKWELEAAATGDVFNTFGCGKDKALYAGGVDGNVGVYNPTFNSFTNDFVENFYSELIKPFDGMPQRFQSKSAQPPSFNQGNYFNEKKSLLDKKKNRFLQKNLPLLDSDLLKRKSELISDDLKDPNNFPCLYKQESDLTPSAPQTPTSGALPGGKSYRDVLSTKSTTQLHRPISSVLSAPSQPKSPPSGLTLNSYIPKNSSQNSAYPISPSSTTPCLPQLVLKKPHSKNSKAGKSLSVTAMSLGTGGSDIGENREEKKATQPQKRTIVGLNPIDGGNKLIEKPFKEPDTFQKIDRKKKAKTLLSPKTPDSPIFKKSILSAFGQENMKTSKSFCVKSFSKSAEKFNKDGQIAKKNNEREEHELEPSLNRKNLVKSDLEEQDSNDETVEINTETSEDDGDEIDDAFFNNTQQNYRIKQKLRRAADSDSKRSGQSPEASLRKPKKGKQQNYPVPIVYLLMVLTLIYEAAVKFGSWILNLIIDVVCLSYWAIVKTATSIAWKIVIAYKSCVQSVSTFFRNIFVGTWVALKTGIRLTTSRCNAQEDHFLVGLEENIVLPTCCEEVLERLYTCHPIDAYSILGLKVDCSLEDIRRCYKRQAYLVRPERRLNFGVEQAHRLLTTAFDLLKEPDLRRDYDSELLNRVKMKNSELDSILSDLQWNVDNSTHILHCDCGVDHLVYRLSDMKPLRYCKKCGERHLAKNNDIWVETRIFGLVWTYYTCLNGICFDITMWANCEQNHLKHIKANSHQAYYRLQNVSLPPGHGEQKKHRCTQGFDDSPAYHANFQYYRSLVEREGGSNSNLSKTTYICCCANSLLNTTESLENEIEDEKIPIVACCMGGTFIGVSTNASSAFACNRSSADLDPDRAKRAGRRRRIR